MVEHKTTEIDESDIFKSLGHKIRREIIKFIGAHEHCTFTDILKGVGGMISLDSPTLSYHLKSLQSLILLKDTRYSLNGIGQAALNLLVRSDTSIHINVYKKQFLKAYYYTVICWIGALTIYPLIYNAPFGDLNFWFIHILLTVISVINFMVIWRLRKQIS